MPEDFVKDWVGSEITCIQDILEEFPQRAVVAAMGVDWIRVLEHTALAYPTLDPRHRAWVQRELWQIDSLSFCSHVCGDGPEAAVLRDGRALLEGWCRLAGLNCEAISFRAEYSFGFSAPLGEEDLGRDSTQEEDE